MSFAPARSTTAPALFIHLENALNPSCAPTLLVQPRCQHVTVEGSSLAEQRAYVVLSHAPSLAGLEFGIVYSPSVFVESWTTCGGNVTTIESPTWPETGTGTALVWDDVGLPAGPDSLVIVGYFTLAEGSAGTISLVADPRSLVASFVDGAGKTHVLDPIVLGRGDVAGTGLGWNTCGAFEIPQLPEPDPEICVTGFQSAVTNAYALCDFGGPDLPRTTEVIDTTDGWPDVAGRTAIVQGAVFDDVPDGQGSANHVIVMGIHETGGDPPFRFWSRTTKNPGAPPDDQREKLHADDPPNPDYPSDFSDYAPRRMLVTREGADVYFLGASKTSPLNNGTQDVLIARVDRGSQQANKWAGLHLSDLDNVAGAVAIAGVFSSEDLLVGGISRTLTGARIWVRLLSRNLIPQGAFGTGPVGPKAMKVHDVAYDPSNRIFYVAGENLDNLGGAVIGFELSSSGDPDSVYTDPFFARCGVPISVLDIELDGDGNIYVGGMMTFSESNQRMFVGRHAPLLVGGDDDAYIAPYLNDDPESGAPGSFRDLVVTDAGLAIATGNTNVVSGSTLEHSPVVWRTERNGDIRWETRLACLNLPQESSDVLSYRAEDGAVFVAGRFYWEDEDCLPGGHGPCTQLFQLEIGSGELIEAFGVDPSAIDQTGGSDVRSLLLGEEISGGDRRVYVVASEEIGAPTRSAGVYPVVHAFDTPVVVVDVADGEQAVAEPRALRVNVRQSAGRLAVSFVGSRSTASVLELFDAAGRRVFHQNVAAGNDRATISGLGPGIYFIRVAQGTVSGTAKAVLVD